MSERARPWLKFAPLAVLCLAGCATPGPAPVDDRSFTTYDPVPSAPASTSSNTSSSPLTTTSAVPAEPNYVSHTVMPGETLYGIAFANRMDARTLARWNEIPPPYTIYPGQRLRMEPPPEVVAPIAQTTLAPTQDAPLAVDNTRPVQVTDQGTATFAVSESAASRADDSALRVESLPPSTASTSASSSMPSTSAAPVASTSTSRPTTSGAVSAAIAGGRPSAPPRAPVANASGATTVPSANPSTATATPRAETGAVVATSPTPRVPSTTSATPTSPANTATAPSAIKPATPTPPATTVTAPVASTSTGTAAPTTAKPSPATATAALTPSKPVMLATGPARKVAGIDWRWPAAGAVLQRFVAGDAARQGLDIQGSLGHPVAAAADGEVVYSGNGLLGYGELIIIKHSASFLSAYGHNRKRLVGEGERVKAGQQIAEMGGNGSALQLLHFEIRQDGKPVDPLRFLPPR